MSAAAQPTHFAPSGPECLGCRYPLLELTTNVCPECGRAFDLMDPRTYGPPRPTQFVRRLVHGALWKIHAPTIIFAALILLSDSLPGGNFGLFLLLMPLSMFVLAWIIMQLVCLLSTLAQERVRSRGWAHPTARVLIGPMLLILACGACWVDLPLRTRFLLSMPAFNAAADQALAGIPSGSRWIGLYSAYTPVVSGNEVAIGIPRAGGMFDSYLFVRSPSGPPKSFVQPRRLIGSWYVVNKDW